MSVKKRKIVSRWSFLLIVCYGAMILYFTLFADRLGRNVRYTEWHYNLVLFNEIHRFITYRNAVSTGAFVLNIMGNLLVFAPLGFLIPLWDQKKSNWYHATIYAFSFSLCIELIQLVTCVGVFDVDDILMNTLGGLLGWIAYGIVYYLYILKTGGRNSHGKKNKKKRRKHLR